MNDRKYGYARVSSDSQNLDRQLERLKEHIQDGRDIFCDVKSGKDFDRREYQTLKRILREGDTLYITELDRLGRNYGQIKQEYNELSDRGINLVILETPMLSTADKSDLERRLICTMIFELRGIR